MSGEKVEVPRADTNSTFIYLGPEPKLEQAGTGNFSVSAREYY